MLKSSPEDMKNITNYYHLLRVQPDAPFEIIRASYRAFMRDLGLHPDLGGDQLGAALLNEAYETLSNSRKRAEYDRTCGIVRLSPNNQITDETGQDRNDSIPKEHFTSASAKPERDLPPDYSYRPAITRTKGHSRCYCNTRLIRRHRRRWMKLLICTKRYSCPLCKESFLWFYGYLIKI